MVDGVLYTSTSFSQVAAIDAASGETLWVHDPKSYLVGRPANFGFIHRGVAEWTDGSQSRMLVATGGNIPLDQALINVGRLLHAIGQDPWPTIGKGLDQIDASLERATHVHAEDGLGNVDLAPARALEPRPCVDVYRRGVADAGGGLPVVAIGPLATLADLLDVDFFICGHQPQDEGYDILHGRMIILASDHNHGVFLPLDLNKPVTLDGLTKSIRPFAAIA